MAVLLLSIEIPDADPKMDDAKATADALVSMMNTLYQLNRAFGQDGYGPAALSNVIPPAWADTHKTTHPPRNQSEPPPKFHINMGHTPPSGGMAQEILESARRQRRREAGMPELPPDW